MSDHRRPPLPVLLTVPEVAETLRTSSKVVYGMIALGKIPGVTRIGRRVLVRRNRLEGWLSECCDDGVRRRRATDQA